MKCKITSELRQSQILQAIKFCRSLGGLYYSLCSVLFFCLPGGGGGGLGGGLLHRFGSASSLNIGNTETMFIGPTETEGSREGDGVLGFWGLWGFGTW